MRFSKAQLFLLAGVFLLILFFVFKGFKTSKTEISHKGEAGTKNFDIPSAVENEVNGLDLALKNRVRQLEDRRADTAALKQLVLLWDSLGKPLPGSYYMMQLAEAEPGEGNWFMAGTRYYNIAAMTSDSLLVAATAGQAKYAFTKVLELNPGNLQAKNALAACYVEVDNDVMKGVGLLKEVVEEDSNNVQAIFTLGMLSMRSGQLEKAQQRFEKLVRLEPFNPEYYFYLGEVYAKTGDTKEALITYEKCKTLLKDKEAKKEVDIIINKLKTI